ncbi:hypothetical protein [Peristeroidobacter soli]|uniref:hypothetical protein n=1 Tax=Peristeroidobacter soli TaxID=2497877 RepID=UPI00101B9ACD|nr:hypothetical protein [Peristeroidobacter soli]
MRFSLFVISVVFTGTALVADAAPAADFRVLDFGAPCDRIAALEAARGSASFEGKLPSGYQFAFRIQEFDRDGLAVYSCDGGKLFRGGYIFDAKDEADAAALYATIKKRVTRERGTPSYDFASAAHRKKMGDAGATLSRVDTLVAFWSGPTSEAHASVAEPSKDRGWRVSLSYTANSHVKE